MKINERYTSIVIASHIPDELRAKIFLTSLDSLFETTKNLPVEIIVVDNGRDLAIAADLKDYLDEGKIQCLIHNANNMHFGFARSQGIKMAKGEYLCIADNDILFEPGWLEACWKVLEAYPKRKLYATPIEYPTGFLKERYDNGKLMVGDIEYNLNMRAGSNCFVMRRNEFDKVGPFACHRVAGTKWTDKAVKLGYLAAVAPGKLAKDMGLRQGYDLNQAIPIVRTLRNGETIYFNQDEYKIPNQ